MKVLVVGGGGREHALVWKIKQSPRVDKIFCAPGNAGIGELAEIVPIAAEDVEKLATFAARERVALTVVGPELPLTLGIADLFRERGLKLFGPDRQAARLEGSKAFAKEILQQHRIPTSAFGTFTEPAQAKEFLRALRPPYVVKADGLAAGKGVAISATRDEAERAVDDCLVRGLFGAAGRKVVIEEFLAGEEASFMILCDGRNYIPLASSQDHKRVYDDDKGPNTGGMGAYSPAPVVTLDIDARIRGEIIEPLLGGLAKRGICYRGVLYAGLMIGADGPKVLEFNARFGDPECQAVLMRLKSDLVPLLEATADGRLEEAEAEWRVEPSVCVVLCARGYPGAYDKGKEIRGLEKLGNWERGAVFHAGTAKKDGRYVTSGGRVLGVTAWGESYQAAAREAYRAIEAIHWDGMHYRRDIARRALDRERKGR